MRRKRARRIVPPSSLPWRILVIVSWLLALASLSRVAWAAGAEPQGESGFYAQLLILGSTLVLFVLGAVAGFAALFCDGRVGPAMAALAVNLLGIAGFPLDWW